MPHQSALGTTVYIREESDAADAVPFTKVERDGSITLQSLMDVYNISCVVECNEQGQPQPRTVVIDAPKEVLHKGSYYITRKRPRDGPENTAAATAQMVQPSHEDTNARAVHFNTRVAVKEYSLPSETDRCARPSLELLSEPTSMFISSSSQSLDHSRQQNAKGGPSKMCFKAFTSADSSGRTEMITLDTFKEMHKKSVQFMQDAKSRHDAAVRSMDNAVKFLSNIRGLRSSAADVCGTVTA